MIKKTLLLVIFLFLISNLFSQESKLDSLWTEFRHAKHDTMRVKYYLDIGSIIEQNNTDSALILYQKALDISEFNIKKNLNRQQFQQFQAIALRNFGFVKYDQGEYEKAIEYYNNSIIIEIELSKSSNLTIALSGKKGLSMSYGSIGNIQLYQSNYDNALENYSKSLKISEELKDKKWISACYSNIGNVHYARGTYDKSIEAYLKSLKINEEIGDRRGMSYSYTNIGNVNAEQENFEKALEYYTLSSKIKEELNDQKGMSICYTNIGNIQHKYRNFEKALEYYLKSLKIKENLKDKNGISTCYNNIGFTYKEQEKYDLALDYFSKSLNLREEIGDKEGIANSNLNIGTINSDLSASALLSKSQKINYLNKSIDYFTKAFDLSQELKTLPIVKNSAKSLMLAYEALGNDKLALKYSKIFISAMDSMFSEEKTNALAKMGAIYESEKRDLTIQKLEKEKLLQNETIARQDAENKKQRTLILSFIAGFILILTFSILLYRLFLQKKKANLLLAEQNAEILQQKEEISTQRDEIEGQRDLVTIQKNKIEEIHKEVTDSINYAKRIQEAVLPISISAREILGSHFILFHPKDIVSGDFYYVTKVKNWLIVAVADCTGHGVPGAFMSMLGISFLNEIVQKQEINKASQILNELRKEIINALQQKGNSGEQKDGMDMSLLAIDSKSNNAQWAGANNPLWVVKSKKFIKLESNKVEKEKLDELSTFDFQLEEVKPDKMPIAIYEKMDSFTNHELQLQKGDCIYLMTDGYEDQFGGLKGKKFLSKNLKQLIVANCQLPMIEQNENLEKTLVEWIGEGEQIDDITILGIKI